MSDKINVITTCWNNGGGNITPEDNLNQAVKKLDAFSKMDPDLICLPEAFCETGVRDRPASINMTQNILNTLSRKADDLNSYIIAGGYEYNNSRLFNAAWLIDRQGKIIGRYYKKHPTINEIEKYGITPGEEIPVFETDFGTLGITICYDIGWPYLWKNLKEQGAELVVWISAYDGGFPLQTYAWNNLYYIVSSSRGHHSKVIDKTGKILSSSSRWMGWASEKINLNKEVFHIDYQYEKIKQIQKELGNRVTVESFSEENIFTLESNSEDWPVDKIIQKFKLETFTDYHKRAEKVQNDNK
ncbi:MAG: carbon-nitrogen hydrolase family protein [bacterium]